MAQTPASMTHSAVVANSVMEVMTAAPSAARSAQQAISRDRHAGQFEHRLGPARGRHLSGS